MGEGWGEEGGRCEVGEERRGERMGSRKGSG